MIVRECIPERGIDHIWQATFGGYAIEQSEEPVSSCLSSLFHRVHEFRQRPFSLFTEFRSVPLIFEIYRSMPCFLQSDTHARLWDPNSFTRSGMFGFFAVFIDLVFSFHTLFDTYARESEISWSVNFPSIMQYLATNRFQVWVPILILRPVSGLKACSSRWVSIYIYIWQND